MNIRSLFFVLGMLCFGAMHAQKKSGIPFDVYQELFANPGGLMMDDGSSSDYGTLDGRWIEYWMKGSGPVFDNVYHNPTHNDWGHTICHESFAMGADVTLDANGTELRRKVEIRLYGIGGQSFYVAMPFAYINNNGVDAFQVPFPNPDWHDILVTYQYNADPDGNGPLDQGYVAGTIAVSAVQPHPYANTQVNTMTLPDGSMYLQYTGQHRRYNEGGIPGQYSVHRIVQLIDEFGVTVSDEVDLVDQSGSTIDYFAGQIDMSFYPPGEYCLLVTLVKSHDYGGYQDFTNYMVDQTDGESCQYWNGNIGMGIPCEGAYDVSNITYSSGVIFVGGIFREARIIDAAGRQVMRGTMSSFDTAGLVDGVYLVSIIDTVGIQHTKRFSVIH